MNKHVVMAAKKKAVKKAAKKKTPKNSEEINEQQEVEWSPGDGPGKPAEAPSEETKPAEAPPEETTDREALPEASDSPTNSERRDRRDRHRGGRNGRGNKGRRPDRNDHQPQDNGPSFNLKQLQEMTMPELNNIAKDLGIENFGTMKKHEVIFEILKKNAEKRGALYSEGVLEILPEVSDSFVAKLQYLPCLEDIYVSPSQIRRFDLQTGDRIQGQIRSKEKERFSAYQSGGGR